MAKWTARVALTSEEGTLQRAERLIQLAETTPGLQDPLLGSAIVLLATALDQAINYWLKATSLEHELAGSLANAAEARDLLNKSAWARIKGSPPLRTSSPFDLNTRSDYTVYLRELVDRRNRLLHIEEDPAEIEIDGPTLEEDPTGVALRDALAQVIAKGQLDGLRLGLDWSQVTPAEARRSLQAVRSYRSALFDGDEKSMGRFASPSR